MSVVNMKNSEAMFSRCFFNGHRSTISYNFTESNSSNEPEQQTHPTLQQLALNRISFLPVVLQTRHLQSPWSFARQNSGAVICWLDPPLRDNSMGDVFSEFQSKCAHSAPSNSIGPMENLSSGFSCTPECLSSAVNFSPILRKTWTAHSDSSLERTNGNFPLLPQFSASLVFCKPEPHTEQDPQEPTVSTHSWQRSCRRGLFYFSVLIDPRSYHQLLRIGRHFCSVRLALAFCQRPIFLLPAGMPCRRPDQTWLLGSPLSAPSFCTALQMPRTTTARELLLQMRRW